MKFKVENIESFLYSFVCFFILSSFTLLSQSQSNWKVFLDQSDASLMKKDYKNALDFANKSLVEVKKGLGERSSIEGTILGKIGRIYFLTGHYDEAIDYYKQEKSIIIEKQGVNSLPYSKVVNNLSVVYQTLGQNSQVENLLLEAVKIKKELLGEQDTSYAKSLNNLAQFYLSEGKFPQAESLFLQSLAIKKQQLITKDRSYLLTLVNLALLYRQIGDIQKCKSLLEEAYSSSEGFFVEDDQDYINIIYNLGIVYLQTGEATKASPLLEKIKKIEKISPTDLTINLAQGQFNLAQLKIGLKQFKEAEVLLQTLQKNFKAKFSNSHPFYIQITRILGITYWMEEKYNDAYTCLGEAMKLTELVYDNKSLNYAIALHNYAGILKEIKEFDEAEENYKKSFDVYKYQIRKYFPYYSENEKTKFYLSLKEKFEMYNCFITERQPSNPKLVGDMYDFLLETKGILLNYSKNLKNSIYQSNDKQLINKYNNWVEKKEYIVKLYGQSKAERKQANVDLDSLEIVVNNIEKELSLASSKFTSEKNNKEVTWRDIQARLKNNEAAIEIVRFKFFNKGWVDSTYYAAMVLTSETKDYPLYLYFQNGNDMDNVYQKNYKSLIKSKFPDKKSYKVFWSGIEDLIKDKSIVYLSADGVFNSININTLQREDGSYVIDNKMIYNVSSTKDILDLNSHPNKYPSSPIATLFGNPKFNIVNTAEKISTKEDGNTEDHLDNQIDNQNSIEISELPGTKKEIENISKLLENNKWKVNQYVGLEANESRFKKVKSTNLLHVATHGYFFNSLNNTKNDRIFGIDVEKANQNPLLRSGLLLAGASNSINLDFGKTESDENGVLTAYETLDLDLHSTNLVVLSACETGTGEVMNGEGVYGLQRAFLVAGAKSLIMSLWTVDDTATQELMTSFYSHWLNGESVSLSFRQAQISLKEKYKQPYYWGAFILLGEVN